MASFCEDGERIDDGEPGLRHDDEESEWDASGISDNNDEDAELPSLRRASIRSKKTANYVDTNVDDTFNDRPGYTHFGRLKGGTGKGACKTRVPKSQAKIVRNLLTIHNFFAAPGES